MKFPLVDGIPFRSKEMSWLAFNSRVLQEAADAARPLGERIRFLGIYSSNLDEFFRVRVATLRRLILLGKDYRKLRLPDPRETLREARRLIRRDGVRFDAVYRDILRGMARQGVRLISESEVPKPLWDWLYEYFFETVRPRIMPVMVRSYSRFGSLADTSMYLAVELGRQGRKGREGHALIRIPSPELPRFVTLPEYRGERLVMYLDDIIRFGMPSIFTGLSYNRFDAWAIKFTRDAELEFDDDITASLYDRIAEGLRARQTGEPVRMNYDGGMPKSFLDLMTGKLKLSDEGTLLPGSRYHNRRDLMTFPVPAEMRAAAPRRLPHRVLTGHVESIFRILQERDVLLHLPWHSFSLFLDFLREASLDPYVDSIRLTQYRLARHSCVASALITAAQNGKEVTVLVEPQARFDEQQNISWAQRYQEAGVKVILGVPGLKVHAKMAVVTRNEHGEPRHYSALGTGNFNEETSRFYTDHLLMTARQEIGEDVVESFRFFETNWQPPELRELVAAPFRLRAAVTGWIRREMEHAAAGREAWCWLKLNNLADPELTGLLYEAAAAGVKIRLVVRSMFSVAAGHPKVSEGIEAKSIVDGCLEHSRILVFGNGGSPAVYLSSADFLPRNFDSRFEIVFPVRDAGLASELMQYFELQWHDTVKARVLDAALSNRMPVRRSRGIRCQEAIPDWLSGKAEGE
jgi:polyphosphate kinase